MTEKKRCQSCNHVERAHFIGVKLEPGEDACVANDAAGQSCTCKAWVPPLPAPQNNRDEVEARALAFLMQSPGKTSLAAAMSEHLRDMRTGKTDR